MTGCATSAAAAGEFAYETGDRFALECSGSEGRFILPDPLVAGPTAIEEIEDEQGRPIGFAIEAQTGELVLRPGREGAASAALWLEYRQPGSYRLLTEAAATAESIAREADFPDSAPAVAGQSCRIRFDTEHDLPLLRPRAARPARLDEFELSLRAARLATHGGFDQLLCLPLVRDMELLEHQLRTAKTVLRRLRGRAMLCDEVGLGKTVEAGLVLSELSLRGLARSVLVLVPPSLVEQWQGELRRKFSLDFTAHDDPAFRARGAAAWGEVDRVIASIHTAKREPHRSAIVERPWDLVIVDEAHHLRNRTTQLWRFASELKKQYMLLLTATPVQNHLDELFNLVTLLEPGLLSTARQFERRFVDRRDKLAPKNVEQLHELLKEVMVRNRRSTVGLQFTRRWARTERLALSPGEAELYRAATEFVRARLRSPDNRAGLSRTALITLQMALGSSTEAAAGTLGNMSENARLPDDVRHSLVELRDAARRQPSRAKVERLLTLLDEFRDKIVIFTQFRATHEMLAARLTEAGHEVALFHGGLTRLEKEAAIARFRGPARVLLASEAGSEGRNLQFAHAVCNYDLPWNPMKIEQRIGRLSRIGQKHDVHVFNLVAAQTLEAAVLHLLDAKLSMFELVIGEIDMILGNLGEEEDFQDLIAQQWAAANDADDFGLRMDALGERLLAAKQAYLEQRSHDDRIFGNRFAPEA